LGPRKMTEDVVALAIKLRPSDRHEPDVVGARIEAKSAQPLRVKFPRNRFLSTSPIPHHGWVFVEFRHDHLLPALSTTMTIVLTATDWRSHRDQPTMYIQHAGGAFSRYLIQLLKTLACRIPVVTRSGAAPFLRHCRARKSLLPAPPATTARSGGEALFPRS